MIGLCQLKWALQMQKHSHGLKVKEWGEQPNAASTPSAWNKNKIK